LRKSYAMKTSLQNPCPARALTLCTLASFYVAAMSTFFSCSKNGTNPDSVFRDGEDAVYHDEIVLGDKLENPYSVENVKSALETLYPGTKAAQKIGATDLYVRFLPVSDEQLEVLKSRGLILVDHPVDYEIVRDGDYYHDPSLDDEEITWQYSIVPVNFVFPKGIEYEVLESCFLAENADTKSVGSGLDDVDWEAVETEAFRQTGNEGMLCGESVVKSGGVQPSGRITIIDDKANGGQPFGVAGVKVVTNVFIKFSSTYTSKTGFFTIPKKYTANPRYRLVFSNEKGFGIGFNLVLVPASTSTLGKGSPEGIDVVIDKNSDRKLFRRCVVNNAAYEFFDCCSPEEMNLTAPPADTRFWMFDKVDRSRALMLHHGTVLDKDSASKYLKIASMIVEFFGPDITLGSQNLLDYSELYRETIHQLAHCCHFSQVGTEYWNEYLKYELSCALSGQEQYGNESISGSGYCGLAEMWAYFMEAKLYKERYGSNTSGDSGSDFGTKYWFRPQILTYLEDRGLTASMILEAMTADVHSRDDFKQKLIELYPQKKTNITQIFNRYE